MVGGKILVLNYAFCCSKWESHNKSYFKWNLTLLVCQSGLMEKQSWKVDFFNHLGSFQRKMTATIYGSPLLLIFWAISCHCKPHPVKSTAAGIEF